MEYTKKQIITIGGRPGSGKSVAAKNIAEQLNFMHFSSGDLFRAVSHEHGQDILQSNLSAEKEDGISKIDLLVDQRLRDIGKNDDRIIIDSRMAWHWMPYSFKVFLDLDLTTAAQRILASTTPERMEAEHISNNLEEYIESLQQRLMSESRRYKKMYNIDPYVVDNYDLVINTKENSKAEVVSQILSQYEIWHNTKK